MTPRIAMQVLAICREVLEDPSMTLDSTATTVKSWDSLGHMNLIAAIEAHWGVELDVMEMAAVDGVQTLVDVVAATLRGGVRQAGGGA